jgi:histidinol-phosphatase (PHP family)
MCRRAIDLGMSEIAFTEHVDFEPTDPTYGGFDHSRYMGDIAEARQEFGDRLIIHAGVECDYQDRYRRELEAFLSDKDFDYVLGGAHYADGLLLETHHETYFPKKTEREAYTAYFDTVRVGGQLRLVRRYRASRPLQALRLPLLRSFSPEGVRGHACRRYWAT